jgi:hypothetical protein
VVVGQAGDASELLAVVRREQPDVAVIKERVSDLTGFAADIRRVAGGECVIDAELVSRLVAKKRERDKGRAPAVNSGALLQPVRATDPPPG